MSSRRSRERMRERGLWALHDDSFSKRWFRISRTYWPGRGFKRELKRAYLFYAAPIAALTVLFLLVDLWHRIFGG